MGYNVGEGVLDYSYCEDDVVRSAKANIRGFIHILIGIAIALGILSFLMSTIIGTISCMGGCMGCEACLETAACADECSCVECDYEQMTADRLEGADERVACDGYDCGDREGCMACGGCGDCSQCAGYEYDSITIVVGDSTYDREIEEDETYLSISTPSEYSEPYFTYLGLYDEDGTRYVNQYGTIEKSLKDGLVLYAKFEETNAGVAYELFFNLSELGMENVRLAVTVGGAMPIFPTAPERDGYRFKGWYTTGGDYVTNGTDLKSTFHLRDFHMYPDDWERVCTLLPWYEEKTQSVSFYVDGSYCMTVTKYYDSPMSEVFEQFYYQYYDYRYNDNFFGWALKENADPSEKIADDALLKEDMNVYAILREAIKFYFYDNTYDWDNNYTEVKFHEGATNVVFDEVEDLASFKEDSKYPGYKFVGWYTMRNPDEYDQAVTSLSRVEWGVDQYYYAKWEVATYQLTYWVMDYRTGELGDDALEKYHMGDVHPLITKENVLNNVGYEFVGWCFDEDCLGTVYTDYLPDGTYGDKNLYAKFVPDVYTVTLIAPGGTFNSGSNLSIENISYGSDYTLSVPKRTGYDFAGWLYGDLTRPEEAMACTDGEGKSLKPFTLETLGLEITESNEESIGQAFELFAKWEIQKFTVTFISEGMTHETCEVEWGKAVDKTMPDPVKEGHTFKYWMYEGGGRFNELETIDEDLTLYAHFEINRYTITFKIDNIDCPVTYVAWGTTIAEAETRLVEPPYTGTPRKRVGWFTTESYESGTEMEADATVTKDLVLHAKYDYAVKFTFHGAVTKYVEYYYVGDTVDFPEDTKTGYNFVGWCSDDTLTSEALWKQVKIRKTTPTTFYAKREAIKYALNYYLNKTDTSPWYTDTYTIEYPKDLIAVGDDDAPEKAGYTFQGWTLGGMTTTQISNVTGEKNVYAIFTANGYQVTLADEGNYELKNVTFDAGFNLGVPSSAREGHDFIGWSWEQYGDELDLVTDNTGKSLTGVVYKIDGNATAYPVFRLKQYSVYWYDADTDSNHSVGKIAQTPIKHFECVQKPVEPVKTGYDFEGWYVDKDCTTPYEFDTYQVDDNVVVWAKFAIKTYKVTVYVGNMTPVEYVLTYDELLETTLADEESTTVRDYINSYTAEGNWEPKFKGWKDMDTGAEYTASSRVPAKELELQAEFDYPITVHYVLQYGDLEYEDGPYYAGDTIYTQWYERKGYSLAGWYTSGSLTPDKQQSSSFVAEKNVPDYYLYAKWTANQYSITYYYKYSPYDYSWLSYTQYYTTDETQDVDGLALWETPYQDGKVFKGWYKDSYGSGAEIKSINNYGVDDDAITYGNMTFYGQWEEIKYSVKFFIGDKEQTGYELSFTYGQSLYGGWVPSLPEDKEMFLGWRIKGGNTPVIDANGNWMYENYQWKQDLVLEAVFY